MKFGDRLRQGREARGITLDAVLKETHIAKRYLDALERSDPTALPGGVFNRAYIRSYADFVGIDPAPILEAYEAAERKLRGTTAEGEDRVLRELSLNAERRHGPPRGWSIPPAAASAFLVLAMLAGGIWLLLPNAAEDEPGVDAVSQAPKPNSPEERNSPLVAAPTGKQASSETVLQEPTHPVDVVEPDASRLAVTEAGFGTAIIEHALSGRGDRFAEGTRVFFWNRVMNGKKDMVLRHVWKLEGEVVMSSDLVIGGPHWRTYSSYTLPPGSTGSWTVEAIGPDGRILSREDFACFEARELETRRGGHRSVMTPSGGVRVPAL